MKKMNSIEKDRSMGVGRSKGVAAVGEAAKVFIHCSGFSTKADEHIT